MYKVAMKTSNLVIFESDRKHVLNALLNDIKHNIGDFDRYIIELCDINASHIQSTTHNNVMHGDATHDNAIHDNALCEDTPTLEKTRMTIINDTYNILNILAKNTKYKYAPSSADAYITIHTILLSAGYTMYKQIITKLADAYDNHPLKWFISSPFIHNKLYKYMVNECTSLDHILYFSMLITNSRTPISNSVVKRICYVLNLRIQHIMTIRGEISTTHYVYILAILFNLGHQQYTIVNTSNITLELYKEIQQYLQTYIKWYYTYMDDIVTNHRQLHVSENEVAFVMNNPNVSSSDYKGLSTFIHTIRNMGYKTTVIHTTMYVNESDIYDFYVYADSIKTYRSIFQKKYKLVFYGTTTSIAAHVCCNLRLGEIQVGLLGNVISSCMPNMDYFITSKWDNECNYTEKLIRLSGMGCSVPLCSNSGDVSCVNKSKNDTLYINVIATGGKFNPRMGKLLETINNKITKKIQFFICLGVVSYNDAVLMNKLYLEPCISNYTIVKNDSDIYKCITQTCDVILYPFPYSSYISIIDSLSIKTPSVIMRDSSRYASCCGACIMDIMGLTDTIVHTEQAYVDMAVKLIEDSDYRQSIVTSMESIDFNDIILKHNKQLKIEFKNWIISISYDNNE